ncbi:hypothetical protein LZ30DRAFT_447550 [Colletotrichum cereale]|nr:hypothetical protein LZ30DRAFT_447550 [Colletotrichum cereale]
MEPWIVRRALQAKQYSRQQQYELSDGVSDREGMELEMVSLRGRGSGGNHLVGILCARSWSKTNQPQSAIIPSNSEDLAQHGQAAAKIPDHGACDVRGRGLPLSTGKSRMSARFKAKLHCRHVPWSRLEPLGSAKLCSKKIGAVRTGEREATPLSLSFGDCILPGALCGHWIPLDKHDY